MERLTEAQRAFMKDLDAVMVKHKVGLEVSEDLSGYATVISGLDLCFEGIYDDDGTTVRDYSVVHIPWTGLDAGDCADFIRRMDARYPEEQS